jgi:glutaredoxin 3
VLGHDVAVFTKVGCPYCAKAEDLLASGLSRQGGAFTLLATVGTAAATRDALGRALGLPTVTFPVIFVRGVYVGGSDELHELVDMGLFGPLLQEVPRPCSHPSL